MKGILSSAPGTAAIRLMVGTHLLLMIQAALVLWSAPRVDLPLRVLVALVFVIAASALCAAVHGVSGDDRRSWRRRRHGR